ncbi:MAG: hypothetical protein AAFX85_13700 [Pseudomonadota bacterium]
MSDRMPPSQAHPDVPPTDADDALARAVVGVLDEQASSLDGYTRSRLRQARAKALAARTERQAGWQGLLLRSPLGSGAVAVALVALVALMPVVFRGPGVLPSTPGLETPTAATLAGELADEFEIVLAGDSIEMLEDLEFYEWLAAQPVI